MITLRLDPALEQAIERTARNLGLSKSDLVRKSISEYLARMDAPTPWEAGNDLFGRYSSGVGDLSSGRREWVKDKIRAKRT